MSRASFWWLNGTILQGFKRPIKEEELHQLHPSNKISRVYERFNRFYRKKQQKKATQEHEKSAGSNGQLDRNGKDLNHNYTSNDHLGNGKKDSDPFGAAVSKADQNGRPKLNGNSDSSNAGSSYVNLLNKPPTPNVVGPLIKAFWPDFLKAASFRFVALCFQFLNPILLDRLLTFVSRPNGNTWEGLTYGTGMFASMLTFSLLNNQHEFRVNMLAMKVRSALTMAIYEKTLVLSRTGRNVYATGEIVNLMSSDCERIFDFCTTINQTWVRHFESFQNSNSD